MLGKLNSKVRLSQRIRLFSRLYHLLITSRLSTLTSTLLFPAASQLVDLISSPKTFGVTTLSTLYPNDHPVEDLRGQIASGAEYFAPACFEDSADLLMLGMPVWVDFKIGWFAGDPDRSSGAKIAHRVRSSHFIRDADLHQGTLWILSRS